MTPKFPDLRNRELKFGKKQDDGKIPCSADVITKEGADGKINHITLDNPTNLHVAGEEFQGKRLFGREAGLWIAGESNVKKVVFDGTGTPPQVSVFFDHPLKGATESKEPLTKTEFADMVSWVEGARKRALSPSPAKVVGVSPKANLLR